MKFLLHVLLVLPVLGVVPDLPGKHADQPLVGLSYLESRSILPSTYKQYLSLVTQFMDWCHRNQLDWLSDTDLDLIVVTYFDKLFWVGTPSADGSKALAALKFFLPNVSRLGAGSLPRSHRALSSWTRLRPGRQRLPLPWIVMTAILGLLCHQGELVVAFALLLQFRTYLRPGVCDNLRVKQLIAPTSAAGLSYQYWALNLSPVEDLVPGKTGEFDESIMLDTDL